MKRKKDLSEEAQQKLSTTGDTEDAKTNKNATPNKKVSYEFSTYGEEPKHINISQHLKFRYIIKKLKTK